MQLTLPDHPALDSFDQEELRRELAIALYGSGRVSREVAARIAGMERLAFDEELFRRRISPWSRDTVQEDLDTLKSL